MGTGLEGMFIVSAFSAAVSVLSGIAGAQASASEQEAAQKQAEDNARGMQVNISDGMASVPLMYGQLRVGINRVYADSTGAKNNDIHLVGEICEGEVDSVVNVYADDKLYNDASYKGTIAYEFFTGTSTQAVCATLHTAIPTWIHPKRYTCYIYVRLTYDQGAYQNLPEITVELKGCKVYDPRTATTAYSTNPALIVRDLITRSAKRGGLGVAANRLDDTSFGDCATYCEAKGWTCNIRFADNKAVIDNISKGLATFRGDVIYSDGLFKLRYRDYALESSVMTITENDVKCDAAGKSGLVITQPSIFDTPNAMRAKYVSPVKQYQFDEFVLPDPAAIASDGDYREAQVDLQGVTDFGNVGKLTAYELARRRVNKEVSFPGSLRCARLEPLDLVRFTHSIPGWYQKVLRTMDVSIGFNSDVIIKLIEESGDLYYDTYSMATHTWRDTNLPDPTAAVPGVQNVSVSEQLYNYGDRSFTRLIVNFSGPDAEVYPWWKHAEVWVSVGDELHYKYMTASTSDYMLDPVQEGVTYYITLVGVSIFDAKQDFDGGYSVAHQVAGKTALPSDPPAITAVAAGDTVTVLTQDITDPDIVGYEVRYGDTWNAALLLAFTRSASVRLTGVKPGDYTFWLGVKDNRGLYNANKRSATCHVFYPSGYVNKNSWLWDFTTGTHSGTKHGTYNSADVLQVDRGLTDNLVGTWTSPEYDLGSVKTIRCWGDFISQYVASNMTWAGVFGSNAWTVVPNFITKRWYEIFVPTQAAQIAATIYWGNSPGNLTYSAQWFQLLAPEFTARYVQVAVTITDPTVDAVTILQTLNMIGAYWS